MKKSNLQHGICIIKVCIYTLPYSIYSCSLEYSCSRVAIVSYKIHNTYAPKHRHIYDAVENLRGGCRLLPLAIR